MSINAGLDIGAVSLKLAAIGAASDSLVLASLPAGHAGFFPGPLVVV